MVLEGCSLSGHLGLCLLLRKLCPSKKWALRAGMLEFGASPHPNLAEESLQAAEHQLGLAWEPGNGRFK